MWSVVFISECQFHLPWCSKSTEQRDLESAEVGLSLKLLFKAEMGYFAVWNHVWTHCLKGKECEAPKHFEEIVSQLHSKHDELDSKWPHCEEINKSGWAPPQMPDPSHSTNFRGSFKTEGSKHQKTLSQDNVGHSGLQSFRNPCELECFLSIK